jgi:16S rRNA (cytidine1402-2'-O)-methyltransferase
MSLATLNSRMVTIGRELTKQFEEIATLAAQALPGWLAQDANRLRGEFTLVVHPVNEVENTEPDTRVLRLLLAELPLKTAVKLAAEITGESRNALYELALHWKSRASPPAD